MTIETTNEPMSKPGATSALDIAIDKRGSWIPNGRMISTRFMELRKRRGLMIALAAVNIGVPVLVLTIRLIAHAVTSKAYGPAGGYTTFNGIVAQFMFVFGFIVAAVVGCTAGSVDLSEGMFRHHVITGRSRLALYLARIPAGLAIVLLMVGIGFAFVCTVCTFAAPTQFKYDGVNMPGGLSRSGLDTWASTHAKEVDCNFNYSSGPETSTIGPPPCTTQFGNGGQRIFKGPPPNTSQHPTTSAPTQSQIRSLAIRIANQNYSTYSKNFLSPPIPLMIETGLWISLEAVIGFMIGLGLSSLMGQRTVPVILLIVFEVILTPLLSHVAIPHFINLQRGFVGLAMTHIEPSQLPSPFGGGQGPNGSGMELISESRSVAVTVIVAWLIFWTGLGAWRMSKRDA